MISPQPVWITAVGAVGLLAVGYVCGHIVASRRRKSLIAMEAIDGPSQGTATVKGALAVEKLAARYDDFKMVLVVRNDLKMGKGKIAAQCG